MLAVKATGYARIDIAMMPTPACPMSLKSTTTAASPPTCHRLWVTFSIFGCSIDSFIDTILADALRQHVALDSREPDRMFHS